MITKKIMAIAMIGLTDWGSFAEETTESGALRCFKNLLAKYA